MKRAVVTLTKEGLVKAKEIKSIYNDMDVYVWHKWNDGSAHSIETKLSIFVDTIFHKYDIIIFIMSTGIVIRVIAKHLKHKAVDPAILVMDEKGKFVISLLSGHIGGANEETKKVAKILGAQAVITTASDVKNSIAVDTLAMKLGCEIGSFDDAKNITGLIVNDEKVGLITDVKIDVDLPHNIKLLNDKILNRESLINKDYDGLKGLIYISNKKNITSNIPKVQLMPKNIIIGVGCKRDTESSRIIDAIKVSLDNLGLNEKSIKTISTVDIKKDEIGIIETSKYFDVNLEIIHRQEISEIENKFQSSDFVKKTIGVGSVCEPCGYISSNNGKCIMNKKTFNGITLSIWEEKV